MPEIFEIKNRLGGLKSINNITYAMQIVTISRLKRITAQLTKTNNSFDDVKDALKIILSEDRKSYDQLFHPKLDAEKAPVMLMFFSNRGFCGSFNQDVMNRTLDYCKSIDMPFDAFERVLVGKKAGDYLKFCKTGEPTTLFAPEKDTFQNADLQKLREIVNQYVAEGRKIYYTYFKFQSIITQHFKAGLLFPADISEFTDKADLSIGAPYYMDPSREEVTQRLVEYYYFLKLQQAVRNSSGSEFGQRFLLMKSAVDSIKDLTEELTVQLNKERQRMITQEISEIIGTFKALQKDRR